MDTTELTPDERQLLLYYRRLNKDGRHSLLNNAYMHTLSDDFTKRYTTDGKVTTLLTGRQLKRE